MQTFTDLLLFVDGLSPVLGQIANGDIDSFTEKAVDFLQSIGLVLAIGAMIYAGYCVSTGETGKAITAFIGAMIVGSAPILVNFAFSVGG